MRSRYNMYDIISMARWYTVYATLYLVLINVGTDGKPDTRSITLFVLSNYQRTIQADLLYMKMDY
jgi:hypothetical protein